MARRCKSVAVTRRLTSSSSGRFEPAEDLVDVVLDASLGQTERPCDGPVAFPAGDFGQHCGLSLGQRRKRGGLNHLVPFTKGGDDPLVDSRAALGHLAEMAARSSARPSCPS